MLEVLEVPIVQAPLSGGPSTPAARGGGVAGRAGWGSSPPATRRHDAVEAEIDGGARADRPRPFGVNVFARPAAGAAARGASRSSSPSWPARPSGSASSSASRATTMTSTTPRSTCCARRPGRRVVHVRLPDGMGDRRVQGPGMRGVGDRHVTRRGARGPRRGRRRARRPGRRGRAATAAPGPTRASARRSGCWRCWRSCQPCRAPAGRGRRDHDRRRDRRRPRRGRAAPRRSGTAFMRCPEAGTSAPHREALAGDGRPA